MIEAIAIEEQRSPQESWGDWLDFGEMERREQRRCFFNFFYFLGDRVVFYCVRGGADWVIFYFYFLNGGYFVDFRRGKLGDLGSRSRWSCGWAGG